MSSRGWLRPLHGDWPSAMCRLLRTASAVVRVLVVEVRGSAPREPGACMLITANEICGTIGGGHLEWEAIEAGRALLGAQMPAAQAQRLVLGTQLGQCCGGVVQLWYERYTKEDLPLLQTASERVEAGDDVYMLCALEAGSTSRVLVDADEMKTRNFPVPRRLTAESGRLAPTGLSAQRTLTAVVGNFAAPFVQFAQTDESVTVLERISVPRPELWIFGAGHVGQALVRILSELQVRVSWVDSRAELLPSGLPAHVRAVHAVDPVSALEQAPRGSHLLVLTHDHGVDYALCRAALHRNDFAWLGLIGSESKAARFRSRLRKDGISTELVARLTCPIGLAGVASKEPAAIAVGAAAQLLRLFSRPRAVELQGASDCNERDCSTCGVMHERLS